MQNHKGRILATCFLVASLASCKSVFHAEGNIGHEYFEQVMTSKIGMKYDDPPSYTGIDPEQFVGSNALLNGHMENSYRLNKGCTYYFEIDPNTSKILAWRYKGSDNDCAITPPAPSKK